MPRVNLTARNLATLKAESGKQTDYFDKGFPGFGVRVGYGGKKIYFLMYRRDGPKGRMKIGDVSERLPLAEARKFAKQKLGGIAAGQDPTGERAAERRAPTVSYLIDVFLREHASKKRTAKRFEAILRNDVEPEIGHLKVKDVRRPDIRVVLDCFKDRGAWIQGNCCLEIVRVMFNFAIDDERERFGIEFNPSTRLKRNPEQRRTRWLSAEEIETFWSDLDNEAPRLAAAWRIALLTAQRQENVLGIRWRDIDWADKVWSIPETKTDVPYEVPLSGPVLDILETLKAEARDEEYVFPKRGGPHVHRQALL